MQRSAQNTANTKPNSQPPGNHDGSDKNYGGFDENGRSLNPTEQFPGNSVNPGNKSNYADNHGAARCNSSIEDGNGNDDLSRASKNNYMGLAQDAEFEDDDAEDLESDVELDDTKSNGGSKEEKGHT